MGAGPKILDQYNINMYVTLDISLFQNVDFSVHPEKYRGEEGLTEGESANWKMILWKLGNDITHWSF